MITLLKESLQTDKRKQKIIHDPVLLPQSQGTEDQIGDNSDGHTQLSATKGIMLTNLVGFCLSNLLYTLKSN